LSDVLSKAPNVPSEESEKSEGTVASPVESGSDTVIPNPSAFTAVKSMVLLPVEAIKYVVASDL
jgi:hypothetical protein